MSDRSGRLVAACLTGLLLAVLSPSPAQVHADVAGHVVRTVDEPAATTPDTTVPETTEPETTEPDTMDPGATNSDESDVGAVTIVGVFAFALLVLLASWWMIQRRDDDAEPHPRPPDRDEPLPGQDLL